MLTTVLALLSAVGPVTAALPEFANLISRLKDTFDSNDAETLERAYELAKAGSDEANAELSALVAERS